MAITYEEALRWAERWARGNLSHTNDIQTALLALIAQADAAESMKWSALAQAIAAGGLEIKVGQNDLPNMEGQVAVRAWLVSRYSGTQALAIGGLYDVRILRGDTPAEAAEHTLRTAVGE